MKRSDDEDSARTTQAAAIGTAATQPPLPADLTSGDAIDEYVIEALVGRGGSGTVFAARHKASQRLAAIKVMHGMLAISPKMVERFVREVSVVRFLRHPSIVEIYDLGKLSDGRPYYVMEYLDGKSLSKMLRKRGRLPVADAIAILGPVCSALQAAHDAGVVHRDVKASNIVVVERDAHRVVKLLDFGVAKLMDGPASTSGFTTVGTCVGTVAAMAPEHILGAQVDGRADVYALGLLLYEMLTGQHPFWSDDDLELARRHIEEPAPRPSLRAPVPPILDGIVLRCLEKDPDRRFESVRSFFDALCAATSEPRAPSTEQSLELTAAGIYVNVAMDATSEEFADSVLVDLGRVLDLAEEALDRGGFWIALATGNAILAVRPLRTSGTEGAHSERRAVLAAAASLHKALVGRAEPDGRVHPSVALHVDKALLRRSSNPELVGGPLAELRSWPLPQASNGLYITHRAAKELGEADPRPIPPGA